MIRDDLRLLGLDGIIDVVLELRREIEALRKENEALRAQLGQPPKTPQNSSIPPSQARKSNKPDKPSRMGPPKGHRGTFRALSMSPDQVIEASAKVCPHCDHPLSDADQEHVHAYDHVELPPIHPVTTRVHLHRGVCPHCKKRFVAPAPEGMEPSSPFGPHVVALILYLHVVHALSFKRMVEMLAGVFGLIISQGAIVNILARARAPMHAIAEDIAAQVRASKVIASDETSARVKGKNFWQWVWLSTTAVYHVITDSRGAKVPIDFLKGAVPEVWVADRYGAQNGHGRQRQVCLAHLLRDTQYAIDAGDKSFAPGLKKLLKRAIRIEQRRRGLKDDTLQQYFCALYRELNRLLALPPTSQAGVKLAASINRCYYDLFVFATRRDVPSTNNVSERALRPSVIFRKVTGGFRSQWSAHLYAAIVSVIATERISGKTALQAITNVFTPAQYAGALPTGP